MLPAGNMLKSWKSCEKCVIECCAVVMGTAIAMGAAPFNFN